MKPNVLTSILLVPLGAVFAGAETINIQLEFVNMGGKSK
jgi:hypothetical protein